MTKRPDLVLLTAVYPFGNRTETFLEPEIEVLAERFGRIHVLPSHREPGVRALPANAELVEMDWLEPPTRAAKRRALLSPDAARVLRWMRRARGGLRGHLGTWRTQLDLLATNILKRRSLESFVRSRRLYSAVFYDYWLENSTLALALLRRTGRIATAIARAHGFDVYGERWEDGRVPFQEAKSRGLDLVFAVSREGAAHLEADVDGLRGKVRVARLGVRDPGRACLERRGPTPLIVSCSRLLPHKQVHLVPEVLASLGRPLRWVHLGDGPERDAVKDAASRLPSTVVWELAGHLDSGDVLRFYERNHVDVFLSLSTSEGLPVSMMEAQSHGIPIVARGVHGVPEIVTSETGVLLPLEASVPEIAAAIRRAIDPGRFDSAGIRAFFLEWYEARANYNRFADEIIALRKAQAAPA